MLETLVKIVTGVFLLIMLYLFLARGPQTVAIITSLFQGATEGIEVLQGR
ncbi:MAG TPA: hypothetical protein VLH15_04315 [Dehalococcoidales bacterium]|nr:hypothetical protein [Dehalococcoidales bacterium]